MSQGAKNKNGLEATQNLAVIREKVAKIADKPRLRYKICRIWGYTMCEQCDQPFEDYKAIQFPTDGIILCPDCYSAIVMSDESVPQAIARLKAEKSKQ